MLCQRGDTVSCIAQHCGGDEAKARALGASRIAVSHTVHGTDEPEPPTHVAHIQDRVFKSAEVPWINLFIVKISGKLEVTRVPVHHGGAEDAQGGELLGVALWLYASALTAVTTEFCKDVASLPLWIRVTVMVCAGCLALAVLGLLLYTIFTCWTNVLCSQTKKLEPQGAKNSAGEEELHLGDVTYRSWARDSLYDTVVTGDGDIVSQISQRDSTYSSMSEGTDTSSILSGAVGGGGDDVSCTHDSVPSGPPMLKLTLSLQQPSAESMGRLAVSVVEALNLPWRDYGPNPDPSVQLTVSRSKRLFSRTTPPPLHHLRTRTLRRTRHPQFNEDFVIEAKKDDIKDWILHVSVLDECCLRGSRTLCTGEVRLRSFVRQLGLDPVQHTSVAVVLETIQEDRGLLLVGLSYLPTSQRLNVSITKASDLQVPHLTRNAQDFRPYIRATLVNSNSGRRIQTVRTDPSESSLNPEFCDSFYLDLAPSQFDTVSLFVAVCNKLPDSDTERIVGYKRPRDKVLGAVALGNKVSSERGREHWRTMEHLARRVTSFWHTLT